MVYIPETEQTTNKVSKSTACQKVTGSKEKTTKQFIEIIYLLISLLRCNYKCTIKYFQ